MIFLLYVIALALPTLSGWMLLRSMEGKHVVLFPTERIAWAFIVGTTGMMFLVFLAAIGFGLPLNRWGFLPLEISVCSASCLVCFLRVRGDDNHWCEPQSKLWTPIADLEDRRIRPLPSQDDTQHPSSPSRRSSRCGRAATGSPAGRRRMEIHRSKAPSPPLTPVEIAVLTVLGGWTLFKVFIASVTFLLLVPTTINDAYTNWNLRAKVFFVHQSFDLSLPRKTGEDSNRIGVSSYPPTVPLLKTSVAAIEGSWREADINSLHALWFLCCLVLCYSALRRRVSCAWAIIGVYALAGLPLYLIHGTNAYADVFLSAHILAAVVPLFSALSARSSHERQVLLTIAGIGMALLVFTKNEALLLYLPPLVLLTALSLVALYDTRVISRCELLRISLGYILPLLFVTLPWIGYKISHGMAFGNAQEISALSLHWQPVAIVNILGNTFLEGNWLLLFPFFWILLITEHRTAFTLPTIVLSLFVIAAYFLQLGSFIFTRLSVEAVRQTGYARGLIHIVPLVVIVSILLLEHGLKRRLEE